MDRGLCSVVAAGPRVGNSGLDEKGMGVSEWSLHRSLHRRCQGEQHCLAGIVENGKSGTRRGKGETVCVVVDFYCALFLPFSGLTNVFHFRNLK